MPTELDDMNRLRVKAARDLALTRTALGNLMAAFQKAHIVVTHCPDLVLALAEARQVLGFPFDTAADHDLTEEEAAAIRCDTPDCCGSTSDAKE
jgi:hypothetical protein